MAVEGEARTEERDYYEVLGAEPSATSAELRGAFRDAVLRHHPDRATASALATRRTAVLNRAWRELRDPLRRLHYDHDLERGTAATLDWPLEVDEIAAPARRRRVPRAAQPPSRWHQPQWRNVAGFRVPAEIFMAGPSVQNEWIVANQIAGEDWRTHSERYWLRYAAGYYRERGRIDDWIGTMERLVDLEDAFDTLVQADLRTAYISTGMLLRGIGFLRQVAERYPPSSSQRRWVDRELRALLGEFRDRRVRRGTVEDRAEAAELLLNYLEALDMEPGIPDVRATIVALRRAGHLGRAAEVVERVASQPVTEPARWFSIVQLLTEAGQLDRASSLLAALARGDHPAALDRRRIGGDPVRRIGAARRRLARARERAAAASRRPSRRDRLAAPAAADAPAPADAVAAGMR
jgi:DnaJ-like protein